MKVIRINLTSYLLIVNFIYHLVSLVFSNDINAFLLSYECLVIKEIYLRNSKKIYNGAQKFLNPFGAYNNAVYKL